MGLLKRSIISTTCTYVPIAPALLCIFEGDMGAQANMRRCVRDGLNREIVVTIQRVLIIVEMFLRAGEFIRYQYVFKVRSVIPEN